MEDRFSAPDRHCTFVCFRLRALLVELPQQQEAIGGYMDRQILTAILCVMATVCNATTY